LLVVLGMALVVAWWSVDMFVEALSALEHLYGTHGCKPLGCSSVPGCRCSHDEDEVTVQINFREHREDEIDVGLGKKSNSAELKERRTTVADILPSPKRGNCIGASTAPCPLPLPRPTSRPASVILSPSSTARSLSATESPRSLSRSDSACSGLRADELRCRHSALSDRTAESPRSPSRSDSACPGLRADELRCRTSASSERCKQKALSSPAVSGGPFRCTFSLAGRDGTPRANHRTGVSLRFTGKSESWCIGQSGLGSAAIEKPAAIKKSVEMLQVQFAECEERACSFSLFSEAILASTEIAAVVRVYRAGILVSSRFEKLASNALVVACHRDMEAMDIFHRAIDHIESIGKIIASSPEVADAELSPRGTGSWLQCVADSKKAIRPLEAQLMCCEEQLCHAETLAEAAGHTPSIIMISGASASTYDELGCAIARLAVDALEAACMLAPAGSRSAQQVHKQSIVQFERLERLRSLCVAADDKDRHTHL